MYKRKTTYFLIISICCLILSVLFRSVPTNSQASYEKLFADKTHTKEKFNILVAGDSRIYRGISPWVIENELPGNDVLNFGYSSLGYTDYIFKYINEKLDTSNNRPVVIVLGITPYSFTPDAGMNNHHYQELSRTKSDVYQRRYINPLLSVFDPVKPDRLLKSKKNDSSGFFVYYEYRGWVSSDIRPYDTTAALASYQKVFNENQVTAEMKNNLLEQVKKWTNKGYYIFGFRVPSTYHMVQLENELSGYREIEFQKSFSEAGGIYLKFENKYYQSYDGSHLNRESAIKLSAQLADSIKVHCSIK